MGTLKSTVAVEEQEGIVYPTSNYPLRIPLKLKDALEDAARDRRSTLREEIQLRLEESFTGQTRITDLNAVTAVVLALAKQVGVQTEPVIKESGITVVTDVSEQEIIDIFRSVSSRRGKETMLSLLRTLKKGM